MEAVWYARGYSRSMGVGCRCRFSTLPVWNVEWNVMVGAMRAVAAVCLYCGHCVDGFGFGFVDGDAVSECRSK